MCEKLEKGCEVEHKEIHQHLYTKSFLSSLSGGIHMHAWAQGQGDGWPWQRTSRYSSSVKLLERLLHGVSDWRKPALNRLICRM